MDDLGELTELHLPKLLPLGAKAVDGVRAVEAGRGRSGGFILYRAARHAPSQAKPQDGGQDDRRGQRENPLDPVHANPPSVPVGDDFDA